MQDNFLKDRDIAIIGYAETPIERRSGKGAYELAGEVMTEILEKTGVEHTAIDGLGSNVPASEAGNSFWTNMLADALGLTPRWSQITDIGGSSIIGNVARAAAALKTGMCSMALCLGTDSSEGRRMNNGGYRTEFVDTVGLLGPAAAFGFLSNAYDQMYGLNLEALGALAVAQRNGAVVNPNACETFSKPITVEDYLDSRMIATPIRLLDCVMRCDGASAVLMTTTERARQMGVQKMVHPVAYAEISNFDGTNPLPDPTISGFSAVGPEVLAKAGMTPGDIRQFHPYDDFLIAVMLQLEQIGFSSTGKGGEFLLETDISPTGALPINTGGGQISCGQPGLAGGGVNLTEAVRQMFGEAGERQVPDPENAMVTGIGVIPYLRNWGISTALILEA